MSGGRIIGMMFFSLLALSAFTCAIGMLEPVISWLEEKVALGRGWLCALAAVVLCIVGLPPLLSFSVLKDVHPLAWLPLFHDLTIFGVMDFGIANFMLPLNAILIALFAGWVLAGRRTSAEFPNAPVAHAFWKLILRFIAPLAIIVLMASL
jgi:NSS family neurotransmitter:Na+ symporter